MTLSVKNLHDLQEVKINGNISALEIEAYKQNDHEAYRALHCYKETLQPHYMLAFLRFCNYSYVDAEHLWNNIQHYKFCKNGGSVNGNNL